MSDPSEPTPVFSEPWQAQAFVLAQALIDAGAFTAEEWAQTLGAEIKRAQAAGDPDLGDTYYQHCLKALERLSAEKGLADGAEITRRAEEWRQAYLATPHGKPVELKAGC